MAVARLAGLLVGDGLLGVTVVAFLAVVAVSSGCVVPALKAHAPGHTPGELVQLHVEATPAGVVVALACHALVRGARRGSAPRPVKVKGWNKK